MTMRDMTTPANASARATASDSRPTSKGSTEQEALRASPDPQRRMVPLDEAIRRIGDGEMIHTFMDAPFGLIGADHERERLIEQMRKYGVENAGEAASAMGHTLVIVRYPLDGSRTTPLFIEAKAEGR